MATDVKPDARGKSVEQRQEQIKYTLPFPEALRGKKLLLATESLGPVNGVSRTTSNLIRYLRDHEVDIAVVAPQQGHRLSSTTVTRDAFGHEGLEIRLHGYPLPYDPTLSVVFPFRIDRLFQRTFDPDLIYLASPASLGFQILLELRGLRQKPPVLLNFQTDLSAYCEILFPYPLDQWATFVFRWVQGYLFKHPSVRTIFYPSSYVAQYLVRAGVPENKMQCLRRGVQTDLFNPSRRDESYRSELAPNKELILLSVARLAPEKGYEFLAKVATSLADKKVPFKLLVVGGNRNPAVAETIHDMFSTPVLQGKVTFTSLLEGEMLARAYASADVFLHSSITETFGLVVLEAMASGIPVVARNEGGPSEIVAHDESGYLVDPDDLDTFVSRVQKLGEDERLREEMGKKGTELAAKATWEKINNQVAWQLAGALEPETTVVDGAEGDAEDGDATDATRLVTAVPKDQTVPYTTRPVMSVLWGLWEKARILAAGAIIHGVWAGLIVTWVMVQAVQLFRKAVWKVRVF